MSTAAPDAPHTPAALAEQAPAATLAQTPEAPVAAAAAAGFFVDLDDAGQVRVQTVGDATVYAAPTMLRIAAGAVERHLTGG